MLHDYTLQIPCNNAVLEQANHKKQGEPTGKCVAKHSALTGDASPFVNKAAPRVTYTLTITLPFCNCDLSTECHELTQSQGKEHCRRFCPVASAATAASSARGIRRHGQDVIQEEACHPLTWSFTLTSHIPFVTVHRNEDFTQ
jgi:hypothetical protein